MSIDHFVSPDICTIFDAVRSRTNGKVDQLEIQLENDLFILHGRTSAFYFKQLAQEAVMEIDDTLLIENKIKVI